VIVGRTAELGRLRAVIDRAAAGAGGAIAIIGQPGIGKSCLAAEIVPPDAIRLYGVQAERDLPFAAVSMIATPFLSHLDKLADPQREAIEIVLGLRAGQTPGRLILGMALLSLLAAAAEEKTLLLLVDDLQWVDQPSQDAIVFVARRLRAESIALILTVRAEPGEPLLVDGLPRIDLDGLSAECATALLSDVHPSVAAALQSGAGGNPLAMIEAADGLTPEQAEGRRAMPHLLAATRPEEAYSVRLQGLPENARAAARIAALCGQAPREVLTAALASHHLGLDELSAVEGLGLMRLSEMVTWKHPLARSAATRGTSIELARAHGALARAWAQVAPGKPAGAWHLSETVTGTDVSASEAMVAVGELAEERGASSDAADAFERAARLCPDRAFRTTLLERASVAATRAGLSQRATDLITEALHDQLDAETEGRLRHALGRHQTILGQPDLAYKSHLRAYERSTEPGVRVRAAAEALLAARVSGRYDRLQGAADMAVAAHQPGDPVQVFLSRYASSAAAGLNRDLPTCRRLFDDAWSLVLEESLLERDPTLLEYVLGGEVYALRPTPLRPAEVAALEQLKLNGDPTYLPKAIRLAATRQALAGHWSGVYVAYEESELMSRLAGQPIRLAESLLALAEADAYGGNAERCRSRLREAREILRRHRLHGHDGWAKLVETLLLLAAQQYEDAIPLLRSALTDDHNQRWALPELIEAIRAVDSVDAAADELTRHTTVPGEPWFEIASAMVDLNNLSAAATIEAQLDQLNDSFQHGRYLLAVGERLRRSGERKAARVRLREAIDLFRLISADPWVARAEAELRATGATLRREAQGERLTSSEHRVATLVAEGRTNKEVAAILFLSPKTMDFHLGRAYRKLEVSNRTALANAMLAQSA